MLWTVYIRPLQGEGQAYHPDNLYSTHFDVGGRATMAEVVSLWNREGQHRDTFNAVAAEPYNDYVYASTSQKWGAGFDLTAARTNYLLAKEKGRMHPCEKLLAMVVDEVFYLPDDPHPVDGHPTLFTNEADARSYADAVKPGGVIKTLKLFAVEKEL